MLFLSLQARQYFPDLISHNLLDFVELARVLPKVGPTDTHPKYFMSQGETHLVKEE